MLTQSRDAALVADLPDRGVAQNILKRYRMEQRAYVVTATWDDEAKVWVAESNDVPGLLELNHQMTNAP